MIWKIASIVGYCIMIMTQTLYLYVHVLKRLITPSTLFSEITLDLILLEQISYLQLVIYKQWMVNV